MSGQERAASALPRLRAEREKAPTATALGIATTKRDRKADELASLAADCETVKVERAAVLSGEAVLR